MNWFFLALAGYFFLALSAVVDKFIVSRTKLIPASFSFYVTLFAALAVSLLIIFERHFFFPREHYWILLVAGGTLYFGLYFMFHAYVNIEISKANPIIISFVPIFTFLLDTFLNRSRIPLDDILGSALIVAGGFALSQTGTHKARIRPKGWIFLLLAGCLLAASNVFTKMAYNELPFFTAFIWQRWAAFLVGGVFLLVSGQWHAIHLHKGKTGGGYSLPIFLAGQAAAGAGIILQQSAIKSGSVSLVSAMNGVQFLFVLLLVLIMSRLSPKFLDEDMTRGAAFFKALWSCVLLAGLLLIFIR
jgi:drug/metabolite transporter (DMT)-like permease